MALLFFFPAPSQFPFLEVLTSEAIRESLCFIWGVCVIGLELYRVFPIFLR